MARFTFSAQICTSGRPRPRVLLLGIGSCTPPTLPSTVTRTVRPTVFRCAALEINMKNKVKQKIKYSSREQLLDEGWIHMAQKDGIETFFR